MKKSNWHHVRSVLCQVWMHPSNHDRRVRAVVSALAWQAQKRIRPRPRDVPFFGLTLRCHPDSGSASNVVYFTERFDPDEMALLEAILGPGDGFVDVGANIGTYTLLACSLVGRDGHVDAFEAHPTAASRLRENVELNHLANVTVHEAAVGSGPGSVEFLTTFDVANSILTTADAGQPTMTVPTVSLDEALAGRPAALGKLDIEGFEVAALQGASGRLASADPPVWLIEVMEWQLQKASSSTAGLLALLRASSFELYRYDATTRQLSPLPSDEPAVATGNLWAVADGHLDSVNARIRRGAVRS